MLFLKILNRILGVYLFLIFTYSWLAQLIYHFLLSPPVFSFNSEPAAIRHAAVSNEGDEAGAVSSCSEAKTMSDEGEWMSATVSAYQRFSSLSVPPVSEYLALTPFHHSGLPLVIGSLWVIG